VPDAKDLIDRLGAAALDARAAIREVHEAIKDLRTAIREAREAESAARTAARDVADDAIREQLLPEVERMQRAIVDAKDQGVARIISEMEKLSEKLLGSGPDSLVAKATALAAAREWSPCPYCGSKIGTTTANVSCLTTPGAAPSPGDLSVCGGCGGYLRFADDLTPRALTTHELAKIPLVVRQQLDDAAKACQAARGKAANHA